LSVIAKILLFLWGSVFTVAILIVLFGIEERIAKNRQLQADWCGKEHTRRFLIPRMRDGKLVMKEAGRWCYQTNCHGETTKCWWEGTSSDHQIPVQ